ncbi:MAG TPA: HAD-IA family hydrolase [Burkholderiales bacterium]|nr:HAD-IA family hydrolase [Burkholderiales bacterium]
MIQGILFDLDGTLADTAPDLGRALNTQLELHGQRALPLEIIRPHASKGARGLIKLGFDPSQEDVGYEAMRRQYLEIYNSHFQRNPMLFPGVMEVLKALAARRTRWAIVTNKPWRFAHPLTELLGISKHAGAIVCGDSCSHAKPHPKPLLLACEQMKLAPSDCVYVGDDRRDLEAATAAGMPMLVAAYGYLGADENWTTWNAQGAINSPGELLCYLDSTPCEKIS